MEIPGTTVTKVDDEDGSFAGAITRTEIPDIPANGRFPDEAAEDADTSPEELAGDESLNLFDGEEENAKDPARLQIVSRAKMRAIGRPNHLMAWHKRALSNPELRPLLRRALEEVPPDGMRHRFHTPERQALCLLLISLFTGRSLAESAGLWIFNPSTHNRDTELAVFLGDDPSGAKDRWRFTALRPEYRTENLSLDGEAYIPEDYLWLPLPLILSKLFRAYLETKSLLGEANAQTGSPPPQRHFLLLPQVKRAVRELLRSLDPSGRLTAARIEATLPARLVVQSGGDVSLSSIVFCRAHPLARTDIYYDGVSRSEAIRLYRELIITIERECLPGLELAPRPVLETSHTNGYIGCRYTPTLEAMITGIYHVKREASEILRWRCEDPVRDVAQFARAHNFYSFYHCCPAIS